MNSLGVLSLNLKELTEAFVTVKTHISKKPKYGDKLVWSTPHVRTFLAKKNTEASWKISAAAQPLTVIDN